MQSNGVQRADEQKARLASGVVAYAMGADQADIFYASRGDAGAAAARHVAMYLVSIVFGLSYARVAAAFGRDRSTASYAIKRVEDWREDPLVDVWLQSLERMLREAPAPSAPPSVLVRTGADARP